MRGEHDRPNGGLMPHCHHLPDMSLFFFALLLIDRANLRIYYSGKEGQAFQPDKAHSQALQPDKAHSQALQPDKAHSQALQPDKAHSQALQPDAQCVSFAPG